ncbi:hypothetical protein R3P38DRAFT_3255997 [Favolaschia claudopus]|uniref:Uncharacterized protein n=1 Tax=Favolaschia claudopus TaxID=2862362 RepID=A0AAW0DFI5_9AGAR
MDHVLGAKYAALANALGWCMTFPSRVKGGGSGGDEEEDASSRLVIEFPSRLTSASDTRSSSCSGVRAATASSACGHTHNIDVDAPSLIPAKDSSRSFAFAPRDPPSTPSRSPLRFPIDDPTSTPTLRSPPPLTPHLPFPTH